MLAGWSSWGAVPQIFDEERDDFATERARLQELISPAEYRAARLTTINAHYTDPTYVGAMWEAVQRLGFDGGRVLEPGSGSGTFIGMAPTGAAMTGVELDPVTSRIAAALYPDAEIRTESFADSRFASNSFDLAIGNVPFGNVKLHDHRHNAGGHVMHNHFILKSLDLVRPGGLVTVLSSSFTLDGTNPAARREMHERADLIGAVRLPSGAHRRTAGTEVVTDLLVFRRRLEDEQPGDDAWVTTQPVVIDGTKTRLNGYYVDHPDRVLGTLTFGHGMYGADTMRVTPAEGQDTAALLRAALTTVVDQGLDAGLGVTAGEPDLGDRFVAYAPDEHWAGHIDAAPDGTFTILGYDSVELLDVPRTQAGELQALLGLRDLGVALLREEASSAEDTDDMVRLRAELADRYEQYVDTYGPINRFTAAGSKQLDEETGEPRITRRTPPVMGLLKKDPFGPFVKALEVYDDVEQTARPATLLTQRVVTPRTEIRGTDSPADALAITLNATGRADLDRVAELLGVDQAEARQRLGTLVFDDPATGGIVPATEYLAGNVRFKLDQARAAAADRPELSVNVAALEQIQPVDLGAEEVRPSIGAVWISASDHQRFLRELLNDPSARVENPGGTVWAVRGNTHSLAASSEWGTERRPAHQLFQSMIEQKAIAVHDEDQEGHRLLNPTETEAAREKAGLIAERFADWVFEDPARADRLLGEYNRRFNSLVLRDYTAEGERLTLPGLASDFEPRPHQRAAVARMISEPAVGLFHQVGAGKTAEMVMGTMELRRLGMANKAAVVVPNHMLEQFSREWLQLYPQARLLAASSDDLARDKRREFVARVATNDWDAVLMTRTAFQRIRVSPAGVRDYMDQELDQQRAILARAKETDNSLTVKRMEKAVLRMEEQLKARVDGPADAGLNFEDTGIDYLVVDEAHDYKNLHTTSNISDAAIDGSVRASDLHMKAELLRRTHGERVLTVATATPIANSVTEAHVMQRFLRPDLLRHAGVEEFDAWAATFGRTVTEMEMSPAGDGSFREKTRFAQFQNVPEMLRMWQSFADVKTAQDLNLPTPDLAERPDGRRWPETVVIEPSPELVKYVKGLGERAEAIANRTGPDRDNMLVVTGDGRRAALDMRLVGGGEPDGPHKLGVAADRIAGIYERTKGNEYLDQAGQPSPVPGALQIVFCDQSTPDPDRWNAYDQLRRDLVDRGVPQDKIRFIHEARNDVEKGRLFSAARSGHVAVLIGSTEKMGVGTNVQARAVALHHLDCPWRPADLEQRDGRILRQGNQNAEVEVIRYTVERSFDSYSWQTVERKAKFINQVIRGKLDVREIEDVGGNALGMAETKALTSGDPMVLEKASADNELARLQRLSRAYQRNQSAVGLRVRNADRAVAAADRDEPALVEAVVRVVPTGGDRFSMTVGRYSTSERADAGARLQSMLGHSVQRYGLRQEDPIGVITQVGGHGIAATQVPQLGKAPLLRLEVDGVPRTAWYVETDDLSGDGLVRQMENRVAALPKLLGDLRQERSKAELAAMEARTALGRPFKHADDLAAAEARSAGIREAIAARAAPRPAGPPPVDQVLAEMQRAEVDPVLAPATPAQTSLPPAPHTIYPPEYGPEPPPVIDPRPPTPGIER